VNRRRDTAGALVHRGFGNEPRPAEIDAVVGAMRAALLEEVAGE